MSQLPMPSLDARREPPILDRLGRPMRSLRISVTDRCNLRCHYCMPEDEYAWTPREEILSFEEISYLADVFTGLGVEKIRLTGGEPLLRQNLGELVQMLAANPRIKDLALTTNGVLLAREARRLRDAGLTRLTVSLDTLRPERFRVLARSSAHAAVLQGIEAARDAGFGGIKINAVIVRGVNDDELPSLIEYGRCIAAEVRFIEYMDVGGATRWSTSDVVSRAEMLALLERDFGPVAPEPESAVELGAGWAKAPAERFRLQDGATFGIIASTTRPFCRTCDRSRLTTDGLWLLCLYARDGVDLKTLARTGATRETIAEAIRRTWRARSDRGAEERHRLGDRGALFPVEELRKDPHREMHARGG
ncbi:MAG: GTP 3',8-cyclase MoaA [Terriglobia bacterium]